MRIGPNIWIKVVEIRGKQVRLGIEAPRDTPIFREELVAAGQAPNGGKPGSGPEGL